MARDLFAERRAQYGSSSAPAGSVAGTQGRDLFAERDMQWQAGLPKWQTGGNLQGEASGWNTPFYDTMLKQQEESARKNENWLDRDDLTGVMTQDAGGFKFGDIVVDRQVQGNLYEQNPQAVADQMMSQLMFDPETQRQLYGDMSKDPEAVSKAVQQWRQDANREYKGWVTQREFQSAALEKHEEMAESGWVEGSIAAGAAGGAVMAGGAMMWAGPLGLLAGGAAGGLVGGFAAWQNQDETLGALARSAVQYDMAARGDGSELGAALQGVGVFGRSAISPLQNLVRGSYDATHGEVGDYQAAFYDLDDQGQRKASGWWQAANAGAAFADSLLTMASPAAAGVYTAQMSAQIGGGVAALASGYTFDDRTGRFDDYTRDEEGNFSLMSTGAAVLNVGIDVAQLGLFHGLRGAQQALAARTTPEGLRNATLGASGWKFQADAAGKIVEGSAKVTARAFVVPSETVAAISTRGIALRYAAKRDSLTVTADDLYRAATSLENGSAPLRNALVNGFGEAAEEGWQQVLEPISHNWTPDGQDVLDAALIGFVSGAGFSMGTTVGSRLTNDKWDEVLARLPEGGQRWLNKFIPQRVSPVDAQYARYVASSMFAGQTPMDAQKFKGLPREARARLELQSGMVGNLAQGPAKNIQASSQKHDHQMVAAVDARRQAVEALINVATGKLNPRVDGAYQIGQSNPQQYDSHMAVMSIKQLDYVYDRVQVGAEAKLKAKTRDLPADSPTRDAEIAQAEAEVRAATALHRLVGRQLKQWQQATTDADKGVIVDALNRYMKQAWDGDPALIRILGEQGITVKDKPLNAKALRRVGTLIYLRDPKISDGSTLALMPQVDKFLSSTDSNNGLMVASAILASIGGDHDGDKMREQMMDDFSEAQLNELRAGAQLLTGGKGANAKSSKNEWGTDPNGNGLNIANHGSEAIYYQLAWEASYDKNSELYPAFKDLIENTKLELRGKIDRFITLDKQENKLFDEIYAQFVTDLSSGSMSAKRDLLWRLIEGIPRMQRVANEAGRPLLLSLETTILRGLMDFQIQYANIYTEFEMGNAHGTDKRDVELQEQEKRILQRRAQRAATEGMTLAGLINGTSIFRMGASAHASKERSEVITATWDSVPDDVREAIEAFNNLGYGMSEVDLIESRGELQDRAWARARELSNNLSQEADIPLNPIGLVLNLRTMFVKDKALEGDQVEFSIHYMTLAQGLIAQGLKEERSQYGVFHTPELEARWTRLEALTRPGREVDAFVEIAGNQTLGVLGGGAFNISRTNVTFNQFVRELAVLPEQQRIDQLKLLRSSKAPEYLNPKGRRSDISTTEPLDLEDLGALTSYQVVVDLIAELANGLMPLHESGLVSGALGDRAYGKGGKRKGRAYSEREKFRKAWEVMRNAFTDAGFTPESTKDLESAATRLDKYINETPNLGRLVQTFLLSNGPKELLTFLQLRDPDTDPDGVLGRLDMWVYEVMLAPNAAVAEKLMLAHSIRSRIYLEGLEDANRKGERELSCIKDRWVRLAHQLVNADDGGLGFASFLNQLMDPNVPVDEFMSFVNLTLRQTGEAPYISWVSDVKEFDPSLGGFAQVVDNKRSTSLDEFLDAANMYLRSNGVVSKTTKANMEYAQSLLTQLDLGADSPDLKNLERRLASLKEQTLIRGWNTVRAAAVSAIQAYQPHGHQKGLAASEELGRLGEMAVPQALLPGFMPQGEHNIDAVTAGSMSDLTSNISTALRGGVYMDFQGHRVTVPDLNVRSVLTALTDPNQHDLMQTLLSTTVLDVNSVGQVTRQSLDGLDLKTLLRSNLYADAMRPTSKGWMTFAMLLDSELNKRAMLGRDAESAKDVRPYQDKLPRMIADNVIARIGKVTHTLTEAEIARIFDESLRDVVEVLKAAGSLKWTERMASGSYLSNSKLDAARAKLKDKIKLSSIGMGDKTREEAELLIEQDKQSLKILYQDALADARKQGDVDRLARLDAELDDALDRRTRMLDEPSLMQDAGKFLYSKSHPREAFIRQNLVQFFRDESTRAWGQVLNLESDEAFAALDRALSRRPDAMPNLTSELWEILGQTAMKIQMEKLDPSTDVNGGMPNFPANPAEQARFDESYIFLVEQALADPLFMSVTAELVGKSGLVDAAAQSEDRLADEIYRRIYLEKLGDYDSTQPQFMQDVRGSLTSASVEQVTEAGGNGPKRHAAESLAMAYTSDAPVDGTQSFMSLTAADFNGLIPVEIPVIGGSPRTIEMPWQQMDGRAVRNVKAFWNGQPLLQGTRDLLEQWTGPEALSPFTGEEFATSPWVRMNIQQMMTAVSRVASAMNKGQEVRPEDISFTFEMLHPDATPKELVGKHNRFYDGQSVTTPRYNSPSLVAELFGPAGGINPEVLTLPLSSRKKGEMPILLGPAASPTDVDRMEVGWQADLAKVLRTKALDVWSRENGTGKPYIPAAFNALYQQMTMRHVVRYLDDSNVPHLMTAEQFIYAQQQPNGLQGMKKLDLLRLSGEINRTMYGDQTSQASPLADVRDLEVNLDLSIAPFTGDTDELLRRVPGLLSTEVRNGGVVWKEGDLFKDSSAISHNYLGLHHFSPIASLLSIDQQRKKLGVRARERDAARIARRGDKRLKSMHEFSRDNLMGSKKRDIVGLMDHIKMSATRAQFAQAIIGLDNEVPSFLANKELNRFFDTLTGDDLATRLVYRLEPGTSGSMEQGVLTPSNLSTKKAGPYLPVYEDMVGIDTALWLADANGDELVAMSRLQEMVDILVSRGVTIALVDSGGARDMRFDLGRRLETLGYEDAQNQGYIFTPAVQRSGSQNARSFESRLSATGPMSAVNRMLVLVAEGFPQDEASAYLFPNRSNPIVVTRDYVPSDSLAGYNIPDVGDQQNTVKAHVKGLLQHPEFIASLADVKPKSKEAKEILASLQRLVDFWDANPGEYLPEELGTGDFIPWFNPRGGSGRGSVYLYRFGYKVPPLEEIRAQTYMTWSSNPMDAAGVALTASATELEPNHTTHTGRRVRIFEGGRGFSMELMVPLSDYLNKLQFEGGGIKVTTTPADPKWAKLKDMELWDGWKFDLVMSGVDFDGKEGDDKVRNMQMAFAFFGVDFRDDLAKSLFGYDKLPTSEEKRLLLRNNVDQFLYQINKLLGNYTETEVDTLLRAGRLGDLLATEIEQSGLKFPSLDLKAFRQSDNLTLSDYVTRGVTAYMMMRGAHPEHVLHSGALVNPDSRTSGAYSRRMPAVFTHYMDRMTGSVREEMFDRFRETVRRDYKGSFWLDSNWRVTLQPPKGATDPLYTFTGYLAFPEVHGSGDGAVIGEQTALRQLGTRQQLSRHNVATNAITTGATTYNEKSLEDLRRRIGEGMPAYDSESQVYADFNRLISPTAVHRLSPMELQQRRLERKVDAEFYHKLTFEDPDVAAVKSYRKQSIELLRALGLSPAVDEKGWALQQRMVDSWVRRRLERPYDSGKERSFVTPQQAMETVRTMIALVKEQGALPTHGGRVPAMPHSDLMMIFEANRIRPTWAPSDDPNNAQSPKAVTWEDWLNIAFGSALNAEVDLLARAAIDASMHTYEYSGDLPVGSTTSLDKVKNAALILQNGQMLSSVDPAIRRELEMLSTTGLFELLTLQDLLDAPRVGPKAEASETAKNNQRFRLWKKKNNVMETEAIPVKSLIKSGRQFTEQATVESAGLRVLSSMRVATTLANTQLWMSALLVDGPYKILHEKLTKGISGTSLSAASTAVRSMTHEKVQALVDQIFGESRFTLEQMQHARTVARQTGGPQDRVFRDMMWGENMFQQHVSQGGNPLVRGLDKAAQLVARTQDPMWGNKITLVRETYLNAVLNGLADDPLGYGGITIDYILDQFETNAEWVKDNLPELHQMGVANVMELRSLKQTLWQKMLTAAISPLVNSNMMLVKYPAHLFLKIPLTFSTFGFNIATTLTGTQVLSTGGAMLLHGRETPLTWLRRRMGKDLGPKDKQRFDLADVIDSVDLATSAIRSGVSLTMLFGGAMIAGGMGLTGEDEESRRRRRAAQLQGLRYVYDPRQIENDWRNVDTVFLDSLPFGLGALFRVTPSDSVSGSRSMASMHWMVKQFLSPIIGVERFMETGDTRHIFWGFEDAILSFPLINEMMWTDTVNVAAELNNNMIEAAQLNAAEAMPASLNWGMKMMMSLESMLFEMSFVNQLYVAMDEYDRDPYVIPQVIDEDTTRVDKLGQPVGTDAMTEFIDPETGDVSQGYIKREGTDQTLHAFSERRASLMLFMSLITGQPLADSSYNRYNMVPKVRNITLEQMEQEVAEGMFLSVWDEKTGEEILTEDGARAIFHGLYKGSVNFDSPSLYGVYVDYPTRLEIAKKWKEDLVIEGMEIHGLSEYAAKRRMYDIWNGNGDPYKKATLQDILFSDEIPYTKTVQYNQLNTTYIQGPDGLPWATGVARQTLLQVLGIPLPSSFYTDEKLNVDDRLNNTDPVFQLNTGMRGLERRGENWGIPTDEELQADLLKQLEDILDADFSGLAYKLGGTDYSNGYGNYRRYNRGYSRGGSGGGYGSFTRTQTPPRGASVYAEDVRAATTGNPIIRRANLRRERFQATRGRLKEWQ